MGSATQNEHGHYTLAFCLFLADADNAHKVSSRVCLF